jgi:hypothetical protein
MTKDKSKKIKVKELEMGRLGERVRKTVKLREFKFHLTPW